MFTVRQKRPAPPADPETAALTNGELFEAALNLDVLRTVGEGHGLSTNDRVYMDQQMNRLDDEMQRRGFARYSDL